MNQANKNTYLLGLIGIILALHLPFIFAPDAFYVDWFKTDDAFYYFKVAQNVATGHDFTFDGIAPANGFHPLWMFLIIPIFALPGKILPLRILFILLTALNIGTAFFLFRLFLRRVRIELAFIGSLTFSLLPQSYIITTTTGLETGLSAFCIALFLYLLAEHPKRLGWLSLAGAATLFARLDNVFLVYLAGLWWSWQQGLWKKEYAKVWFKSMLRYYAPITLLLLLYFAWNWFSFGTLMPISSQIKHWWGTLANSPYGFPVNSLKNFIGQFVTDDGNIGPWSLITQPYYRSAEALAVFLGLGKSVNARRTGLAILGVISLLPIGWLVVKQRHWLKETAFDLGLPLLFVGILAQITYYKVGGAVAQRFWYWHTEILFLILLGIILLEALRKQIAPSFTSQMWLPNLARIMFLAAGVYWLVGPHLTRFQAWNLASEEPFYERRAAYVQAHTSPGALIGMTGSGSMGYFIEDRVIVNVDGLISSVDYFEHLQAGTAAQYFDEIGLDYMFGNDYIVLVSDPYGEIFTGRLAPIGIFEARENTNIVLWQYTKP